MSYKFGIVGLGLIAEFHGQAIEAMACCEIYSCMDFSEERVNAFSSKFNCKGYTDLDDMLKDPELDIVTICTPSGNHMEPSLKIIHAGKHLIVEKPLEITLERCDAIIDAAEKKGIKLATILPSRFHTASKLIKDALDKNRFGRLVLGDAYIKWFRTQEYYDKGGWHGTKSLDGGGALMNQSIHAIDLLQWFMGPVESVKAYTQTLGHERIEVEDVATAVLKFKNGALGVIEGSTTVYPGYLKKIEISGTDGSMVLEESSIIKWDFREELEGDNSIRINFASKTDSGGGASDPGAISVKPHQWQFEDFISSLDSNQKSVVEGKEGRKAVEIILAIYESAEKGKEVIL
ncbi:MAG: Gfo/Idh/MocA family oxidoreductase [Spirochaetia bacterium]|nr:Gfo/Idh/MocA family oxidoreductase [Spirochaetia bacterium]